MKLKEIELYLGSTRKQRSETDERETRGDPKPLNS